ncbi:cardiac-enriched FHL2-interacting protein [Polypterus senegalus]
MNHKGNMQGHYKYMDGFSDTSSVGSFIDDTDREVSNLTDRAFRSLCIGEDAIYNDSDFAISPVECNPAFTNLVAGNGKRTSNEKCISSVHSAKLEEKSVTAETFQLPMVHNSKEDGNDTITCKHNVLYGADWRQKTDKSIVSSLIKAFDTTGGDHFNDASPNFKQNILSITANEMNKENDFESWDKSALISIQKELLEFSNVCEQNCASWKKRDLKERGKNHDGLYLHANNFLVSEKDIAHQSKAGNTNITNKVSKSKSNKGKKAGSKNAFLHSVDSPFRIWNDYKKSSSQNKDVDLQHAKEFPKWSDSSDCKGLKNDSKIKTHQVKENSDLRNPKGKTSVASSSVMQKASAIGKRCESEMGSNFTPWRKNRNLVKNKLPIHRPCTVSPFSEKSSQNEIGYGVKKSAPLPYNVCTIQDGQMPQLETPPFSISQLLTPVIHARQETDISEIFNYITSPTLSDVSTTHEPDFKAATDNKLRDNYKSMASSLLFNLKDNRKRVKSTYSPPAFRNHDTQDRTKHGLKQERISKNNQIKSDLPAPESNAKSNNHVVEAALTPAVEICTAKPIDSKSEIVVDDYLTLSSPPITKTTNTTSNKEAFHNTAQDDAVINLQVNELGSKSSEVPEVIPGTRSNEMSCRKRPEYPSLKLYKKEECAEEESKQQPNTGIKKEPTLLVQVKEKQRSHSDFQPNNTFHRNLQIPTITQQDNEEVEENIAKQNVIHSFSECELNRSSASSKQSYLCLEDVHHSEMEQNSREDLTRGNIQVTNEQKVEHLGAESMTTVENGMLDLQYYALSSHDRAGEEKNGRESENQKSVNKSQKEETSLPSDVVEVTNWVQCLMDDAKAFTPLPTSNVSSPSNIKLNMFKIKDNTFRASPVIKTVKPLFHKTFSEELPSNCLKWGMKTPDKVKDERTTEREFVSDILPTTENSNGNLVEKAVFKVTVSAADTASRVGSLTKDITCKTKPTPKEDLACKPYVAVKENISHKSKAAETEKLHPKESLAFIKNTILKTNEDSIQAAAQKSNLVHNEYSSTTANVAETGKNSQKVCENYHEYYSSKANLGHNENIVSPATTAQTGKTYFKTKDGYSENVVHRVSATPSEKEANKVAKEKIPHFSEKVTHKANVAPTEKIYNANLPLAEKVVHKPSVAPPECMYLKRKDGDNKHETCTANVTPPEEITHKTNNALIEKVLQPTEKIQFNANISTTENTHGKEDINHTESLGGILHKENVDSNRKVTHREKVNNNENESVIHNTDVNYHGNVVNREKVKPTESLENAVHKANVDTSGKVVHRENVNTNKSMVCASSVENVDSIGKVVHREKTHTTESVENVIHKLNLDCSEGRVNMEKEYPIERGGSVEHKQSVDLIRKIICKENVSLTENSESAVHQTNVDYNGKSIQKENVNPKESTVHKAKIDANGEGGQREVKNSTESVLHQANVDYNRKLLNRENVSHNESKVHKAKVDANEKAVQREMINAKESIFHKENVDCNGKLFNRENVNPNESLVQKAQLDGNVKGRQKETINATESISCNANTVSNAKVDKKGDVNSSESVQSVIQKENGDTSGKVRHMEINPTEKAVYRANVDTTGKGAQEASIVLNENVTSKPKVLQEILVLKENVTHKEKEQTMKDVSLAENISHKGNVAFFESINSKGNSALLEKAFTVKVNRMKDFDSHSDFSSNKNIAHPVNLHSGNELFKPLLSPIGNVAKIKTPGTDIAPKINTAPNDNLAFKGNITPTEKVAQKANIFPIEKVNSRVHSVENVAPKVCVASLENLTHKPNPSTKENALMNGSPSQSNNLIPKTNDVPIKSEDQNTNVASAKNTAPRLNIGPLPKSKVAPTENILHKTHVHAVEGVSVKANAPTFENIVPEVNASPFENVTSAKYATNKINASPEVKDNPGRGKVPDTHKLSFGSKRHVPNDSSPSLACSSLAEKEAGPSLRQWLPQSLESSVTAKVEPETKSQPVVRREHLRDIAERSDSVYSTNESKPLGKPPVVPPKTEKALRRAKKLTNRRKKAETKTDIESNGVGEKKIVHTVSSVPTSPTQLSLSPMSMNTIPLQSTMALKPNIISSVPNIVAYEGAQAIQSFPITQRKLLQDPESGQYFVVDMPVQMKTKTFLDPETGKYVQLSIRSPEGGLSHASSLDVLNAPYVLYPGFLPLPVTSLPTFRSSSQMSAPAVLMDNQEVNEILKRDPVDQKYPIDSSPYIEPVHDTHSQKMDGSVYSEDKDANTPRSLDIISMSELEDFAVESF